MIFDNKISNTVSLSKILDVFIQEDEKSEVILNFLESYDNDIDRILEYSDLYYRLFCLDFIKRCSYNECERLFSMFIKILRYYSDDIIYLIWQVLQSNIDNNIKNIFRKLLYNHMDSSYKHPYRYAPKIIKSFDKLFCDVNLSIEDIVIKINSISNDKFNMILEHFTSSLWCKRFFQMDIFLLLDIEKQYLICSKHFKFGTEYRFIKQLFTSEIDVMIKKELYDIYIKKYLVYYKQLPSKEFYDIKNTIYESYESMIFKLYLYGVDQYAGQLIFHFLMENKLDVLKKFLKNNRELLIEYFNICDFLELIFNYDN